MRHVLWVLLILFSPAFLKAQMPELGLVAYYPFNGNANDESGSNRNGTVIGATFTIDRFNQPNKAFSFDGTNSVTVPNWQILTGNAARSISLWFKMALPPQTAQAAPSMIFWGTASQNSQNFLGYYYNGSTHYFGCSFFSNSDCWLINNLNYFNDRWHHLVFTYNGSSRKLWIDGVHLVTTSTTPTNTSNSELFIGRFIGQLDDIRIYDRGLSDAEVTQIYQSEIPPPSSEIAKIGSNRFIHTVGIFNTSIGNMAGNSISIGTNNTFTGYQAGRDNSSGSFNSFLGYRAGYITTSGNNNVFLGANANPVGNNATSLQNSVALGTNAKVAVSDAIILGDTVNTNIKVGIGTAAPRYPLDIKGNVNIRRGNNGVGKLLFASRASFHSDDQDYIVLSGGQEGQSGLRFANMTNQTSVAGISNQFLSVDAQGRVGVYTPSLSAHQVMLKVNHPSKWADYVFEKDYPLMSLNQLGQYLETNQHLPHLPSAQAMTDKGATVEELIKALVKTQEEQARYLLELKAENEKLSRDNERLRKDNEDIKTRLLKAKD